MCTTSLTPSVTKFPELQRRLLATKVLSNDEKGDMILVKGLQYPSVWLRDNCLCNECFNPHLNSRIIHYEKFDPFVKPASVKVGDCILSVEWEDGHKSEYSLDWLQERNFSPENQTKWLNSVYRLPKVPWGSKKFPSILKHFNFQNILDCNNKLLEWLESIAIHGVAIVEGTPSRKDALLTLTNRISFLKKTHYGELFEVRYKPDTTNSAYLNTPLQMHTDLPYYDYKPGLNLLHCLVQTESEGGANQLTDVLHVSLQLKETEPDNYKLLSTIPVEWNDIGEDGGDIFHTIHRAPVICLDSSGNFVRVNYSQPQRDSHFSVPIDNVIPWYKAYTSFTKALYHPDNVINIKTKTGDILTFDNVRLVHARKGYEDNDYNERHIVGAYVDWDVAFSKIRVLRQSLK